jgi:thioredoxin 1
MKIEMKDNNLAEILDMGGITVIDFYAQWCGPCRVYGPILDKFEESNTDINVVKADVDSNSEVAKKYGIRSIPTTVLFKDGQLISKVPGVIQEPKLQQFIDNLK